VSCQPQKLIQSHFLLQVTWRGSFWTLVSENNSTKMCFENSINLRGLWFRPKFCVKHFFFSFFLFFFMWFYFFIFCALILITYDIWTIRKDRNVIRQRPIDLRVAKPSTLGGRIHPRGSWRRSNHLRSPWRWFGWPTTLFLPIEVVLHFSFSLFKFYYF